MSSSCGTPYPSMSGFTVRSSRTMSRATSGSPNKTSPAVLPATPRSPSSPRSAPNRPTSSNADAGHHATQREWPRRRDRLLLNAVPPEPRVLGRPRPARSPGRSSGRCAATTASRRPGRAARALARQRLDDVGGVAVGHHPTAVFACAVLVVRVLAQRHHRIHVFSVPAVGAGAEDWSALAGAGRRDLLADGCYVLAGCLCFRQQAGHLGIGVGRADELMHCDVLEFVRERAGRIRQVSWGCRVQAGK